MTERRTTKLEFQICKVLFLAVIGIVFVGTVVFDLAAPPLKAQSAGEQAPTLSRTQPAPQGQRAAGGKLVFDSASVTQNKAGLPPLGPAPHTDYSLDSGDSYAATGGRFSTKNFPLNAYISFAYKLTPYQSRAVLTQLPAWAATERFDIEAHGSPDATKDQTRLMVQSLLADRFKLAAHLETHQVPLFALVLANAGKAGPRLKPHSETPPCPTAPPASPKDSGSVCGVFIGNVASGHVQMNARNISMGYLANVLVLLGHLDLPVVDRTGLSGNFDVTMDAPFVSPPAGVAVTPDALAPTFEEVLRDELGVKLEPQTGPADAIVIDHVEELSAN